MLAKLAGSLLGSPYVVAALAALLGVGALLWTLRDVRQGGYEERVAEELREELSALRERNRDDARIRKLSDYELCRDYVRGGGELPDGGACEQLRGLHGQ
ncbi:hypothetical protein [Stappia indica]|uniref:hypothetical protein n=1 Tax=Stappia indica TaxID=538381 RepID=UPI00083224A0|nr:hypothetical protein [Stappia indica]